MKSFYKSLTAVLLGVLFAGIYAGNYEMIAQRDQIRMPMLLASTDGKSFAGSLAEFVDLLTVYNDGLVSYNSRGNAESLFVPTIFVDQLWQDLLDLNALKLDDYVQGRNGFCSADAPFATITFLSSTIEGTQAALANSFTFDMLCPKISDEDGTEIPQLAAGRVICDWLANHIESLSNCPFYFED